MSAVSEPGEPLPSMPGPEDLPARLWRELRLAVRDRRHGWRCPVLATVDATGRACARTVVLRAVEPSRSELVVFTHALSKKVGHLRADPRAEFVFWSEALQWQLRARVQVNIEVQGPRVNAAVARVAGTPAARDYLGSDGNTLHLVVLVAQVQAFEWLALDPRGHRGLSLGMTSSGGRLA